MRAAFERDGFCVSAMGSTQSEKATLRVLGFTRRVTLGARSTPSAA